MDKLDYQSVGLIAGLEVHQQLLTSHKLFCRCPARRYTTTHDGEVLRHMRPTLSELGVYDGTALMEFKTRKEIVYLLHRSNVCTYEMDDTPPFLVNQEAIDIAIEMSLMMKMDIIDEVHIARKQYLDGSIPTGFQRTAIVGVNGGMPLHGRRISITHLSIEEDSCREVSDVGHRIVWRTDRLGMPLTETVTGPDLRTPEEVRDAILMCGLVARSTGRVRTGIGAARQDVNASVRGGNRVEIKGVPRAVLAVKLVHNEAIRQVNLLKLRDELHARGIVGPDQVRIHALDVTDVFAGVEWSCVQESIRAGGRVMAVRVDGVLGLAQHPTQPETDFLDELSGRIRVIACLDVPPIVVSGSRLPEFPNRYRVAERIRKRLRVGDRDDWFLVFGPEEDCRTAAEEIRLRFADATEGIPKETRQALAGGYTTFERILPGPDRMYPDTDSPPTGVTEDRVAHIRAHLKPTPWERLARYGGWRVPEDTTRWLIRRGGADIVDAVVDRTGAPGLDVAILVGQRAKALARRGIPIQRLDTEAWVQAFHLYTGGQVLRDHLPRILTRMATDGVDAVTAARVEGIEVLGRDRWMAEVDRIDLDRTWDSALPDLETLQRRLTAQAMRNLQHNAPGDQVSAYLRARLEEIVR